MLGRAMRLVLVFGWPCALAAVLGVVGVQLGQDAAAAGRRLSTTMFAKYEALSICVQAVTGEQHEAELGRDLVAASLDGLDFQASTRFTVPASIDVGCPRDPAHFGANVKSRRVARRTGDERPMPSPYHLHVYLMPHTTLLMLGLEPDLADRRMVVEEYVVEGTDASAVMTGVTYGLYASLPELGDGPDLRQFFRHALQMQSQLGGPPRTTP
jgi:hypothetical protein